MGLFDHTLADYLALRRSLGHKLAETERQLARFVTFLDFIGAETITLQASLAFVLDPDVDPSGVIPVRRLCAVRGFARYLAGIDPRTEIPPAGIVSYRPRRRIPYLFSNDDVVALMDAAANTARRPLRAAMLRT